MRRLSLAGIALLSALVLIDNLEAEVSPLPGRAIISVESKNKLLIRSIRSLPGRPVSDGQSFEEGMAEAGWSVTNPSNLAFRNVKAVMGRQDLMDLEAFINSQISQARRNRNSIESSA